MMALKRRAMRGKDGHVDDTSAEHIAARTDRETSYHPALESPSRGVPAGTVLVVVLVALLVAGLLNSAWMVRTAEGMRPGLARTIVSTVAVPFDAVASALSLNRPRQQIDLVLGRELAPVGGGSDEIELPALPPSDSAVLTTEGSTPTPPPPPHTAPLTVRHPTAARPLNVLVIGDSLSTYTGRRLADLMAQRGLADVTVKFRDGVGLASPKFFNWPEWALGQIDAIKPSAVVVILGGNDNQDMSRRDDYFPLGSPGWSAEYERRVSVVMKSFILHGVDRIYWTGPPTSKVTIDNEHYHQLNLAAAAAAKTIPGARFVDLAGPTSLKGEWLDILAFGNEAFPARMGDGFHWSWQASQITSRLEADAMAIDYGPLYDKSG